MKVKAENLLVGQFIEWNGKRMRFIRTIPSDNGDIQLAFCINPDNLMDWCALGPKIEVRLIAPFALPQGTAGDGPGGGEGDEVRARESGSTSVGNPAAEPG